MPDLILTDGGLPQVRATKEGLKEAGVDTIPAFGLFKNDKHQTEGLIDENGNVFPIDSKSPLFFLLMRMQDEVHRFAITFHRNERSKAMKKDLLDGIPGIGEKRKELIRRHYSSRDALVSANVEELAQLLPMESAVALHKKLHSEKKKA